MKKRRKGYVSIIIVTHNGLGFLNPCLQSVFKQTYTKIEVIVVDNASTDSTRRYLHKQYPEVVVIALQANYGFAEANNKGFQHATGEYVYFLNNDTTLENDAIAHMVTVLQKAGVGGVQSKLLLMEKRDTLDTIGAFLTPTGFLFHNCFGEKDQPKFDNQIELYTPKGASMMFNAAVLERVCIDTILFDEDYFAYFEETDLAHRVWMAGYTIQYAPSAVVYHVMGATSSTMNQSFVQYHSFKNRIATYIKNLGVSRLFIILPVHVTLVVLYAAVAVLQGKYSIFLAVHKAILWNIFHFRKLLMKRWYIQRNIRTRSDDLFFSSIMKTPGVGYYLRLFSGSAYKKSI